jgi:hypothetical protein
MQNSIASSAERQPALFPKFIRFIQLLLPGGIFENLDRLGERHTMLSQVRRGFYWVPLELYLNLPHLKLLL